MGRRYFYTDPLAAAWMAKHFGMEFLHHPDGVIENMPVMGRTCDYLRVPIWSKFLLRTESLHILEPQPGDFGWDAENSFVACYPDGCFCLSPIGDNAVAPVRIIQRNGIPFIWPESEAA